MAVNPKTKTFAIDVDNPTPLSWTFGRGDAIKMTFTFNASGETYDTTGVAKLRVFAFEVKSNGKTDPSEQQLFGAEFADIASGFIASFASAQTSGKACQAVLTAQLVDSDENLINSANVNLSIYETNSNSPYNPTPNFRDEVIQAAAEAEQSATEAASSAGTAATKATEAAQSATQAESYAQSAGSAASAAVGFKNDAATSAQNAAASATTAQNAADSAVQAAGVAALQVDKLNDGILYFNTGLVSKVGVGLPDFPFTFCTTINISAQPTVNLNILSIAGYEGATGQTLSITLKDNILTLTIWQTPTTTPAPYTSRLYTVSSDFWGAEHTIVWIARSLTSGTAPDWSLYIDGAEVTTTTYGTELTLDNITGTGKFGFGGQNAAYPYFSPNPTPFTARNVRVFNFDLSATDAPYSLDDYHTGKAMPPTICDSTATQRAIIALDNYTIANGATKYVPDISGNSYDSAVTLGTGGYVKGTNDIRIAKLAQYINLQNA